MENLSRIAKGIFLGNGEIWNFLDYAVNRDCGGLISYTQKNDFLGANLINNYDGGFKRRYENSDIPNTNSNTYKTNVGNIGDLYEVPYTDNNRLKFITEKNFSSLHKEYREKLLGKIYRYQNDNAHSVLIEFKVN